MNKKMFKRYKIYESIAMSRKGSNYEVLKVHKRRFDEIILSEWTRKKIICNEVVVRKV